MIWLGVLLTSAGCYLLKLVGLSVLERPAVRRTAELLPVALLAALVGVGTLVTGSHLRIDARAAGVGAAAVALLLRAPFLVVILTAVVVAAGLRLV